ELPVVRVDFGQGGAHRRRSVRRRSDAVEAPVTIGKSKPPRLEFQQRLQAVQRAAVEIGRGAPRNGGIVEGLAPCLGQQETLELVGGHAAVEGHEAVGVLLGGPFVGRRNGGGRGRAFGIHRGGRRHVRRGDGSDCSRWRRTHLVARAGRGERRGIERSLYGRGLFGAAHGAFDP